MTDRQWSDDRFPNLAHEIREIWRLFNKEHRTGDVGCEEEIDKAISDLIEKAVREKEDVCAVL